MFCRFNGGNRRVAICVIAKNNARKYDDMRNRSALFTLLLILAAHAAFTQKYSNEFLAIGVGARAHGMGWAQTALASDVNAAYWNPAGLTHIEAPLELSAMHAEWFAGVAQYDYIGFAKPLNSEKGAVLALSVIRFGIDRIPYTLNLIGPDGAVNYDQVSEFSAADYAVLMSYARQLRNPNLSVGGSFKVVRRVIGSFGSSWGFGADLGLQYRKGPWMLGVQGYDLTTTFNAWSFSLTEREKQTFLNTDNEVPVNSIEITRPRLVLGAAYQARISEKVTLLPALDMVWTTDGQRNTLISSRSFNMDPRVGIEADYDRFVQLRVGVANVQRVKDDFNPDKERISIQPNLGVGLRIGRAQLDYALNNIGNVAEVRYSHIVSFRLGFRGRKSES